MNKAPDAFRTISEVADDLDVPQHVLRFWESRFSQIKPMKRGGGRRYYRPDDVDLLRGIRHLLYGEGYTIRGVQRILREQGLRYVQSIWTEEATQPKSSSEEESHAPSGRERRLLGLLPALRRDGDVAAAEPAISEDDKQAADRLVEPPLDLRTDATEAHARAIGEISAGVASPRPVAKMKAEDLQRLRDTLQVLVECRRALEDAVSERL